MRTIEIQFEHCGVHYSATAEFLPSTQALIRVFEFFPNLPDYRHEVYYVYDAKRQKMEFPFFPKKQKGLAESMFASICECCDDSNIFSEMGLGVNMVLRPANTTQSNFISAA